MPSTGAIVSANTGELLVTMSTNDPRGPFVQLRLQEFRYQTGPVQIAAGSPSGVTVAASSAAGGGGDYGTQNCSPTNMAIEIVEVNQAQKIVSGRFSGKACGGSTSVPKQLTEGQFNLPYTIR